MRASDQELSHALKAAEALRESGEDKDFIAKALLSEHERLQQWMKVVTATKLYLRSGMATTEHARLVKVLHEVEAHEDRAGKDSDFGLE
ncbi:MAG: hypothetical protein R3183_09625 [Oleiphilaceae bacterium]|nr:hypothetical protein [Oleiphilaceae bacterium]